MRIFLVFLLFGALFASEEIVQNYGVTPKVARNILDNGGIVIDIRTSLEWSATGIISGTKLITFYNKEAKSLLWGFIKQLSNNDIKKGTPIVLVCNSGFRSKKAIEELNAQGYGNIRFVEGGIEQWKKDNLPLVKYN